MKYICLQVSVDLILYDRVTSNEHVKGINAVYPFNGKCTMPFLTIHSLLTFWLEDKYLLRFRDI